MFVNSRLKATKTIGHRKAFYRQRIPEPSCARKETVDIDILVTSRNLLYYCNLTMQNSVVMFTFFVFIQKYFVCKI